MDRANLPPGVLLPSSLQQAKVSRLPATAYYIPNFISEEEEKIILDKVRLPPILASPLLGAGRVGSHINTARSPAPQSLDGSSSRTDVYKPGLPTSSRTGFLMLIYLLG